MAQYGFYFDQTACAGCRTCQIACKGKNRLDIGELLRRVRTFETGDFPNPAIYHLSVSCSHCSDPACVAACPTGRIVKDGETGVVFCDPDVPCAGEACFRCIAACPCKHPVYAAAQRQVVKCDMCRDRIAQGQSPACVASCMMRCLQFGPVHALRETYGEGLVTALPAFPDGGAQPNTLIKAYARAMDEAFVEK